MAHKFDVVDGRSSPVAAGVYGIIVAGEIPGSLLPAIQDGELDVVCLKLRWLKKHRDDVEVPVRDLSAQEVTMIVNKAIAERKVAIAFMPGGGNVIPSPGFPGLHT